MPMTTNIILALGIMIIAGFLGGSLAAKIKFPRITGYLIVGVLLSPSVLHIIPETIIQNFSEIISISLGIIAYLIGGSLRLDSIRQLGKSIAWITTLQGITPLILTTLVITFVAPVIIPVSGATLGNTYFPMAFALGAIALATAPAATIAIIREEKAEGPFTTTLLAVVALDDVIAIVAFAIAVGLAEPLMTPGGVFSVYEMIVTPLLHILESVAIGAVLGFAASYTARLAKTHTLTMVVDLATVLLCVGVTELVGGSLLLANMVVGFIVANKANSDTIVTGMQEIEDIIFVVFFVLAGMHFDVSAVIAAGLMAGVIIICRSSGKYLGARIGARISGAPEAVKKYLGIGLLPKAGVTIGLGLLLEDLSPAVGAIMFNALLASTIINELIAPPLTKYAIMKAGEKNSDQADSS